MNEIKVGDYILLSFGHNDEGQNVSEQEYKANMEKFAAEAKAHGANVIMFTPVARRTQGLDGTAYNCFNLNNHMQSMKEVCSANGFPLIDMTQLSTEYLQEIGDSASERLYMMDLEANASGYDWDSYPNSRFKPGTYNDESTVRYEGDNTHFTVYGANVYAQMLAKEIKKADVRLSQYVNDMPVQAQPAQSTEPAA